MDELVVEGLLLLDKPAGPTSHDMVATVRKLCGGDKVGHTGTLDPLATGLLIILVGRATKLAQFVPGDPKVYEGTMLLGMSTDSMDTEGEIIFEGSFEGGPGDVAEALASLQGEIDQVPPMFSAAKHRGSPLYRYARRGETVPRTARKVSVYNCRMTAFRPGDRLAEADFTLECSSGTYVRELVDRAGSILGCGGTLSRLRRTASGPFRVEQAVTLQEASARFSGPGSCLLPMDDAVGSYKRADVAEGWIRMAGNGASIEEAMVERVDGEMTAGETVAVFARGELMGIHRVESTSPLVLRPQRIL